MVANSNVLLSEGFRLRTATDIKQRPNNLKLIKEKIGGTVRLRNRL